MLPIPRHALDRALKVYDVNIEISEKLRYIHRVAEATARNTEK